MYYGFSGCHRYEVAAVCILACPRQIGNMQNRAFIGQKGIYPPRFWIALQADNSSHGSS